MERFILGVRQGYREDIDVCSFGMADVEDPIVTWLSKVLEDNESEIDTDESGVYLEVLGAFSITLV